MDENLKLSFKNLFYRVKPRVFSTEKGPKNILKGVCGEFNGGDLTAIIGLSGSGKSSLLDCLSGFQVKNVTGSITINDETTSIRKVSSYISQDQTLHQLLTVNETMNLSLNLKNCLGLNEDEKKLKIQEILGKLSINAKGGSFVRDLSGGEKKRLSIAVEMIHDPKILFLDEPTTGLDYFSSTHCIFLLKKLAQEGRTVILTIHQPSAFILNIFDHVYALADGSCIYQGSSKNIVQFLRELDLECPPTYNPSDFLLEIANNDYGEHNNCLIEKIGNGSDENYRKSNFLSSSSLTISASSLIREVTHGNEKIIGDSSSRQQLYSTSYWWQVYYIMHRTYLMTSRDKTLFYLRVGIHILIGILFGHIYRNVGNNGSAMLDNYRYLVVSVVFLLYTAYHSHFVTFPLEFPIIKREHFNGWYSTLAYYTAFILFEMPITIVCCSSFVAITYYMTDQPHELLRFGLFLGFSIGMSLTAHVMGIAVTSLMDIKMATILGTFFLTPIFLFSAVMVLTKDVHQYFLIFFELNYLDNALKGIVTSVLGLNRGKLPCDEIYCHFANPKKVLRDFGANVEFSKAFSVIIFYFAVFHAVSYFLIRYRLKNWH